MSGDDPARQLSCAEVRELAPELGLGVLFGVERAQALAHAETCTSCRAVVGEMAEAADCLLGLAPELEPPPGFEDRFLARYQPTRRRPRRSNWAVPALAAAAVVVIAVTVATSSARGFGVTRPSTLHALGGRSLAGAALVHEGRRMGQVFVYAGTPSWLFMTLDTDGPPQHLTCEVRTSGGRTVVLGTFDVSAGYGSWGSAITVDPGHIRRVMVVNSAAQTVASATL